jgi:hypothetical protein
MTSFVNWNTVTSAGDDLTVRFSAGHMSVEEVIQRQEPLISVLRLLILLSITNNGLPKKHFDYFR